MQITIGFQILLEEKSTKNKYVAYFGMANVNHGNRLSFDHKFEDKDLAHLASIGGALGLIVVQENHQIHFEDANLVDAKLPSSMDDLIDLVMSNEVDEQMVMIGKSFNQFKGLIETAFEISEFK